MSHRKSDNLEQERGHYPNPPPFPRENPRLKDILQKYLDDVSVLRPIGRTKDRAVRHLP